MKPLWKFILLTAVLAQGAAGYAQPNNNPLSGRDSLVLVHIREMGLMDVDKPTQKPPTPNLQKPKIDDLRFQSRDVFIPTQFQAEPPKAMALPAPRPDPLNNSFIKLGIGRFLTPMGEIYVHNDRDSKINAGVWFKHQSAYQDIVPLRKFNENAFSATLGATDNVQTIRANVDFFRRGYFFFADTTLEANPQAREDSLRMAFSEVNARFQLLTNFDPGRALHYDLGLATRFYNDRLANREIQAGITPKASYRLTENAVVGAQTELAYVRGDIGDSLQNRVFVDLNPYVAFEVGAFTLNAGIRFNYFNNSTDTLSFNNLGPAVEFSYAIEPNQFEVFAGITSGMMHHTFGAMRRENPYLISQILVRPTITRYNVFLGARGNIGGELDYNARFYYRQVRNQLIYAAPFGGFYFDALYDSLMNIPGGQIELNYRHGANIRAGAAANFNIFNTSTVERFFHAPPLRLDLYGTYLWEDKLSVRGDINFFAPAVVAIDTLGDPVRRKPFLNVRIMGDYRITDGFSVYAGVNNLLSGKFERWYNYFERPIDFSAGLTVRF